VSDPGPSAADAGIRAAVRPFRLAVVALAGPLAPLEALLRAAERLPDALKLELGLLDVAPFGTLPANPAEGTALAEPSGGAGARRPAGTPTARRPVSGRLAPGARAPAPPRRAADAGVADATGAVVQDSLAGTPAAAASSAPSTSLLGRFADAALEALTSPRVPPRRGADDSGRRRPERASPAPGEGSSHAELATSSLAEAVPPGTGTAGVAAAYGPAPDASLLEELAETALAAAEPAPAGLGATLVRQRSAGEESVERAAPDPRRRGVAPTPPVAGARSSLAADLATRSLVEPVVLGQGDAAVAAAQSLAGAALAGELAEAALAAVAPAPAPPAAEPESRVLPERSEGEKAVARLLDRTQAVSASTSRAATARGSATREDGDGTLPVAQPTGAMAHLDLAWLVNEALVEQARRHGVDLS
jgi:hypothetical protein